MCRQSVSLVTCALVLIITGKLQAATVTWTGAGPDAFWSTPVNWDTGTLPTAADTAKIEIRTDGMLRPVIASEDAVANVVEIGWGGKPGELTINGGTLVTTKGLNIGRKDSPATVNVNGGTIVTGTNLTVGYWSPGTLVVNDGSIRVNGTLEIATKPAIPGFVDLRGGTLAAKKLTMSVDPNIATMDMGGGTLIVDGNSVPLIQGYINSGQITAFKGRGGGALELDYDLTSENQTTLTSVHSLQPNPRYYSSVGVNVNQLQWVLPEPSEPGGIVTCDVYFGTNPKVEDNPKVVVNGTVESAAVTLAPEVVYYWALDIYDSSVSDTEPVMLSPIFTFDTKNRPPVVNAGDDVVTWLIGGTRIGNLTASISNDNGPCALQWTVVSEPDDPNSPDAVIANPTVRNTTVALAAAGEYVFQLEAFDGEYTVADTMTIRVYNDSCEAAQSMPDYVPLVGDLNGDCKVDDVDLAILQENWLKDNSLIDEWIPVD